MATSGSFNYSLTAAGIIEMALENLGIVNAGGTVSSNDSTLMLRRLNVIAKQFQGTADGMAGMKVWTRERVTLFLAAGQQRYLIGPASTDARATTSYGRTTISADEASGQSDISITSNEDTTTVPGTTITMTSGDFVAIELNNGVLHWSTISGTPTTVMTIVSGISAAASAGRYVYWFTNRAQKFPVIEAAYLRDSNRNDMEIAVYRDFRAYDLGVVDKYADGTPTAILVEPLRITTRVTLNSQPTDITDQIVMVVLYPAEDYDATTDDIAFPQEWLRPLAWQLSFEAAPAFSRQWTPEMEKNRTESLQIARNINPETSDLYFQPG